MEKSIGNEKEWAKKCLLDLKTDNLEPKYITTDPDRSAYRAAKNLHTEKRVKLILNFRLTQGIWQKIKESTLKGGL